MSDNNKHLAELVEEVNEQLSQDNPDFIPVTIEDILTDKGSLKIILEALLDEFKRTNKR